MTISICAQPVGDEGCQVLFTARTAVEAGAGDDKVSKGLGFIVFFIGARAAAAAEYDEQVQSSSIRWCELNFLPVAGEYAHL
jgi:hypothetical protein